MAKARTPDPLPVLLQIIVLLAPAVVADSRLLVESCLRGVHFQRRRSAALAVGRLCRMKEGQQGWEGIVKLGPTQWKFRAMMGLFPGGPEGWMGRTRRSGASTREGTYTCTLVAELSGHGCLLCVGPSEPS